MRRVRFLQYLLKHVILPVCRVRHLQRMPGCQPAAVERGVVLQNCCLVHLDWWYQTDRQHAQRSRRPDQSQNQLPAEKRGTVAACAVRASEDAYSMWTTL